MQYFGLFFEFPVHFDNDPKLQVRTGQVAFAQQGLSQIEARGFQVGRVAGGGHVLQQLDTGGKVVGEEQADREIESRLDRLRLRLGGCPEA